VACDPFLGNDNGIRKYTTAANKRVFTNSAVARQQLVATMASGVLYAVRVGML
jgi:hypothetical protein